MTDRRLARRERDERILLADLLAVPRPRPQKRSKEAPEPPRATAVLPAPIVPTPEKPLPVVPPGALLDRPDQIGFKETLLWVALGSVVSVAAFVAVVTIGGGLA